MIAAGDLLQTRICTPRCVSCVNQTDEFLLVFIHSEKKAKANGVIISPPPFFFLKIPARDRYHWMALNFIFCVSRHNDDLRIFLKKKSAESALVVVGVYFALDAKSSISVSRESQTDTHTHTRKKTKKKTMRVEVKFNIRFSSSNKILDYHRIQCCISRSSKFNGRPLSAWSDSSRD